MREIRALTSLRGVAAIWVLLFHLDLERPIFAPAFRKWLAIGRGYIAVDLFFVLSGFVLALTYRRVFAETGLPVAYAAFVRRRAARIMPLNAAIVVAIVAVAMLTPAIGGDFLEARDPRIVIANLLLIQDWGLAPSIDKPAWSVSIEMAIYLVFPALLALAWSRRCWIVLPLAGIAGLSWLASIDNGIVSQGRLIGDFVRGFAGFGFGLLCFRMFDSGAVNPRVGRIDLPAAAAFWAALVFSSTDLSSVLICPAIILTLAFERGVLARVLGLSPLHYLGQISYSVYLIHYCVIEGLSRLPVKSPTVYAAAALGLTIGLSTATYRWLERPARRWIDGGGVR